MSVAVLPPIPGDSARVWTVADLEELPPGYRYEILEGVLYMAATPFWPHSGIIDNLDDILGPWVRTRRLGRVLPPQTGIYLNERNYVDPDLVFVPSSKIPAQGERFTTAAIAVEVLSPSNFLAAREDREALLQGASVAELWYVDPQAQTLEIRQLGGEGYTTAALFRDDDRVTSEQLPGLEFPLPALWEDLGE